MTARLFRIFRLFRNGADQVGRFRDLARGIHSKNVGKHFPDAITKETKLTKEGLAEHQPISDSYTKSKQANYAKEEEDELTASMRRLETAGISITVWGDGDARVVATEADAVKVIDDGGVIYSPEDMFRYLIFAPPERRILHGFKKQLELWWNGGFRVTRATTTIERGDLQRENKHSASIVQA